jgi:hypothetical protein
LQALRSKWGPGLSAAGVSFSRGKMADGRTAVWVFVDPSKIEAGVMDAHKAKQADAQKKQNAKKAAEVKTAAKAAVKK